MCIAATCTLGACDTAFVDPGQATASQVKGDCLQDQCDGAGNIVSVADDTDVPDDSNPCTNDLCNADGGAHTPVTIGTSCGTGTVCDANGHCVGCNQPTDCAGQDTDCKKRTCTNNVCDVSYTAVGFVTSSQTPGDCHQNQCDGMGNVVIVVDDNDVPADDSKQCTSETCNAGTPQHPPVASGTTCNQNNGTECDANGNCVQCLAKADCGADTTCQQHTCLGGLCNTVNAPAGTFVSDPTPGDCRSNQCNGNGGVTPNAVDNNDVPADDNNQCTSESCNAGTPQHPPVTSGTTCNQNSGTKCDGSGNCVQCFAKADCGADTTCQQHTCDTGVCNVVNAPAGTFVSNPVVGDCHTNQCDGHGGVTSNAVDDTDVPADDNNQCTGETCVAGTPTHPNAPAGTPCTQNSGTACNGSGACVTCLQASDCGTDTACQTHTCTGGVCNVNNAPAGTVVSNPVQGDCLSNHCDASGNLLVNAPDDGDVPADDNNQCTNEVCVAGVPGHPNAPQGTTCNQNNGTKCDDSGDCVQCFAASDCGTDTACLKHTCTGGLCDVTKISAGTVAGNPVPGDCHTDQCDGDGGVTADVIDDTDVPADDNNQCTTEVCAGGVPDHPNAPKGTTCTQNNGTKCDDSGECVQCFAASDCGTDTACHTFACTSGACEETDVLAGTGVGDPTPGDCHTNQCDGAGNIVSVVDDSDVHVDNNQCTADVCTAGVPSNPVLPAGTACGQNGGTECDATGDCVQCVADSECPPTGTECATPACNAGVCGKSDLAAGTPAPTQTPGDCHQDQCNGSGGVTTVVDDTDVPADDGNPCTSETCNAGVAAHPNLPALTTCSLNGGVVCDDKGTCTNSVQVVRVGDPTVIDGGALSGAATAVFLEERFVSDGALTPTGHNPLPLPTADSGTNAALTLSGTATSEGALRLSGDGHYVTLAGYRAIPGTTGSGGANINTTTSATVNRVVGRVDASGNVVTSTRISNLISANSIRSAVTNDGTSFWVGGGANGVVYVTLGATTGLSILGTPGNTRVIDILGTQLYGSASSSTYVNVFTIGSASALPTTSGQTATSLSGMPTSGSPSPSPYAYAFVGSNVLYVADDRPATTPAINGGGVQKWALSGSTWSLKTTFQTGNAARGVTAFVTGSTTTVVATTTAASGNTLVVFVDDGVNLSPAPTLLATAATNTVFRGVAPSPR